MKKVLKKFNRTLSIMLAAAMVLTMVPQTAMPVLAEEANQIEAQAETEAEVVNEDNKDTTKDIADDEESTDVGEGIEEDNSDIPDTTDDEQTGDGEDKKAPVTEEGEKKTPEGDESGDNQDASDENAAGSDEELTEETKPAEEETVSEDEEESDTITVNGSEVNAVTPAATTITVEQYEKDGTPAATEGGQPTDKKLADDAIAEVTYIDGTSADGSKALGGERPVKFRLDIKDGWKTEGLKVTYSIPSEEASLKKENVEISASGSDYTIPTNVDAKAAQGDTPATPAGYSGNITIKITAVPVKSTVKLAAAPTTGQIVCLAANGTPDAKKTITSEAGQDLIYAEATADVTLAVSDLEGKYRKITVKRGDGETKTVYSSGTKEVGADAAKKTYDLFTFNPSELKTFSHNADNAITVTLETAEAAKTLTLANPGETDKWSAGAVANLGTTKAYITTKTEGSTTSFDLGDVSLTEDNYANDGATTNAKDRVLAFTVTPDAEAGLKLAAENPVKAEITGANNFKKTVNATKIATTTGDNEIPEHYEIALKDAITAADFANGNLTLTIKVDTVVDSTATGVHTITFKGDDLKNVKLGKKVGSDYEDLTSPCTAKMNDITFGIKPKTGYTLATGTDYRAETDGGNNTKTVVTVSYDKVYTLTLKAEAGRATPNTVKATKKVTDEEVVVTADGATGYFAVDYKFKDAANFKDADWKTGLPSGTAEDKIDINGMTDSKAEYTKENVEVTVKTVLANDKSGTVTIVSDDADYEVSGDGITKSVGDTYRISDEATLLTLTIASDVEPTVTYNTSQHPDEIKAGETEGSYIAEIPVSELANDGTTINDTITITKGTKTLTVKTAVDEAAAAAFAGKIWVNEDEVTLNASGETTLTNGQKAEVTFEAPVGTEITGLTTKLGDAEAVEVELKETDKYAVTFPVTMSDAVVVTVSLKSVYAATVTLGSNTEAEEPNAEDVYVIPAGTENIKVSLFKGDATDEDNAATINYVKIYDGTEIAVTTATVASNTATIAKISDKDTGVLKVDLAAEGSNKIVASVQIKQEKAAAKLAVKDAKNKAVTSVSLMADGPAAKYTVTAADGGRLDYAAENIGVEVVAKADDAPVDTPVTNNYVEAVLDENGELTIKALPAMEGKKDAAVVRLYDIAKRAAAKNDSAATDKICLMADAITVSTTDPTVVGQKPTVKEATGSDKVLRVELSTTDKVVKPASNNKVLYKVTIEGALAGTLTDADKTQYFEKTAWGKATQLAEIKVDNTTVDAEGKRIEGSAKDFSLKVELVQTTKQTTELSGDALITAVKAEAAASPTTLVRGGDKAIAELKKISTRNPLYETKLKMKPASVTVYTGQTLASAQLKPQTQAQFDKKTGYTVVPYVQFVNTKTGVLLGTSSRANGTATNGNWSASVDANGNVAIGYIGGARAAKDLPKDIGLKVTAEYPEGAYAATAIVKITVANGIHTVDFASGDYRYVYKQTGKPASLKLTPIFNYGGKDETPKKKNLTFAMGDADGRLPGEPSYNLASEIAAKVKVNQKNGAVTVDKNYDLTKGENSFSVVAMAADYEGNKTGGRRKAVCVEITGTAQSLGDVVIVDEDNKVIARDGGTLNAEDFFTYNYSVDNQDLYVRALKTTAGTKRVYTDNDFVYGVSYATSVKAALGVDAAWGKLDFIKPNSKPVKLTVAAADGSKSKKEISVTVKGFEKLGLEMYDSNYTHYDAREAEHTYDGAMNERFRLIPVAEMWDDYYTDCDGLDYTNYTVTAKGAKITAKYNDGDMDIVMTAPTATITIADKTEKSVKTVYTITQDPAAPATAKAPSIKQIGKLTAADVEAVRTAEDEEAEQDVVKLQVTNKNATPVNHARQYVFLTPDYTKTKYVNGECEYDRADKYFLNDAGTVIEQIDDNGKFALNLNVNGEDTFDIVPGNYNLIATVGNYSDGKFVPAAKGVNVKINIPGKAAKDSLTVKGKYTLDASATAPVDLDRDKNIVTDYHWTLTNAAVNGNYAMNKIDPKTGKPNEFTKYFQVTGDAVNGFKLGLKPNLPKGDIEYITGQVKETAKAAKADCEGYVTVSSYNDYSDATDNGVTTRYINSYRQTKDMKITVTFKDAKYVAKTAESSVYMGAEATVQIFETAKSTEPIALAGAAIEADEKNGGATLGTSATGVEADGKTLKVKLGSAEAGKSYKVTLKILAADSAYAAMTTEGAKDYKALAASNGRTVTATIKVSGKDDKTKNKVAVTGKAFKITADDFTTAQLNTYTLAIPVKGAIEGTTIASAKVADKVKDKDYEGKDIVTAAYDTATGKVTLTVNRGKLVTANAEKGGKFKFNKAVDVPVEFTFADTTVAKETVNLKVTLPNPMTVEKWADAKNKTAQSKTALEAALAAMNADQLFVDDTVVKSNLKGRVEKAIGAAIPADIQAETVTRSVTLNDEKDGSNKVTKYSAKIEVKEKAADTDHVINVTFNKTADGIDAAVVDVDSIVTAIEAIDESAYENLGNDYTKELLKKDIEKALANPGEDEEAIIIPQNLTLSVIEFNLKKATVDRDGEVYAAIYVRDRNDVSAPYYYEDIEEWSENVAEVELTIEQLHNLSRAAAAVKEAVKAKSGDAGIDYTTVIYNALKDATDLKGVEPALKTAIINAAKAAIRNPDIKIKDGEEFEKIDKAASSNNPTTVTTGTAKVDVDFKLPVGKTAGSVSFKLVLKQDGMKNVVVDMATTPIVVAATVADHPEIDFTTLGETVTGLKSSVFKNWTDATPNTADIKDDVYCRTGAEITTEIQNRLAAQVKGVGIGYTVSGVAFKDGATGPSADAEVKAEGTIVITDKFKRGATEADNSVTVKFTATIPQLEKSLGTMKVMGANVTSNASAALTDVTSAGLTVTDIESAATLKFRVDFDGSKWLETTDKAVTYALVESATATEAGKTVEDIAPKTTTGITLNSNAADGTATITVDRTKIADATKATTLYLRVSKNSKKLNTADTDEIPVANRTKIVTVTLNFKQVD